MRVPVRRLLQVLGLLALAAHASAWADDGGAPPDRPAATRAPVARDVADLTVKRVRPTSSPAAPGRPRFYTRRVSVDGLVVQASDRPADAALLEAAWIVRNMLATRRDLLDTLRRRGIHVTVMAHDEFTTQVPEHATLEPGRWWDYRARGLGPGPDRPIVSCAEENLLGFEGDPYRHESILVHEFAHAIDLEALRHVDETFATRLAAAYEAARAEGLWRGTYAAGSKEEYWAEGVQSWFDANGRPDASHGEVDTREELRAYDPRLAALIQAVFGDNPWRYVRVQERVGRGHLAGYDPTKAPRFAWPAGLADWYHAHERRKRSGEGHESLPVLPGGAAPARSPVAHEETRIVFVNESDVDVRLGWIGYDGARTPYGTLRPGALAERQSFVGHLWVVTDAHGRELARFRAVRRPGRAVIRVPRATK